MAVFLFLIIEGFAIVINDRLKGSRIGVARVIAILLVVNGFIGFIALVASGIREFGRGAEEYEAKINGLIGDAYQMVGISDAPQLQELVFNETGRQFFTTLLDAMGGLTGDFILILIYVAFLYAAQSTWSHKLDRIFPEPARRQQVMQISDAARRGIETYLWTQTVISVIITLLTYISLAAMGVDNALFLSALIFVLNYIPTVGSIVAALVPPLFALVQPEMPAWVPGTPPQDTYIFAGIVFAVISFWQFFIGNFVQPRMMGDSLNLSALVVLLSLAIWGVLWGIPGMFLSAPLTVLMMILFAQSPVTRWIAILLSADGNPRIGTAGEAASAQTTTNVPYAGNVNAPATVTTGASPQTPV
jgi:predicted PurR-regulated permease PerM